jgi:hypothetical protein
VNVASSPRIHHGLKVFGCLSGRRRRSWFLPHLPAMIGNNFFLLIYIDSGDDMIQQIMEDEQDFDADVRKHLSTIGCLQTNA